MKRKIWLAIFVTCGLALALYGGVYCVQARETGPQDGLSSPQANASFTYHSISSAYPYCSAVSAADVNRDGDVDILSGNEAGTLPNAGSIHWWQNGGSGSFTQQNLDTGSESWGATSFYANDMDADGDTDLAAISITYLGKFATFENRGGGRWTRREQPSGLRPFSALSPIGW